MIKRRTCQVCNLKHIIKRHVFCFGKKQGAQSQNAKKIVFSGTNQKHVCWKICKGSKVFSGVAGIYFLQS